VFYPMTISKLIVMSVFTLNLYELYWLFRNWSLLRTRLRRRLSPAWRAFFAPFWAFSLFGNVRSDAHEHGLPVAWSSAWLGLLYFALSFAYLLPEPYRILTILRFAAFLPVQATINARALREGERLDRKYSGRHFVAIAFGTLMLMGLVQHFLLPAEP
jgi:hypothetical protein